MRNTMQASLSTTSTPSASQTLHGSGIATGELVPSLSNPEHFPTEVLRSEHATTQCHGSTSPPSHPHPSPSISGLRAPVNSPQVHASSPQFAPENTHDEDVGAALAWFVQNLEGRSLSESMWAPKNVKYAPSPLRGYRVPSTKGIPPGRSDSCAPLKELTPVNVVQPNPAINDSFSRMTFRAADPDRRVSDNIFGERNVRNSTASRRVASGTCPSQAIFASLETPEIKNMSPPPSPDSATLTQADAPSIVKDGIIVTDFAKKENISSSTPRTGWVPPHLRGIEKPSKPSATHPVGLRDEGMKSTNAELTKTVETSSGIPSKCSPSTPEGHSLSKPATLGKFHHTAGTDNSPSLAEIGQNLLVSIVDLESNGCLGAEMIASLYVVYRTIKAQLGDTAGESTGDYCLPAKTYNDPGRPFQRHLLTNTSGADVDDEATKKAKLEAPLTIDTGVPNAVVPGSGSSTPASGYSSTGLGPASFRKILAATSASTANSPIATPVNLSPEKLASAVTSKASPSTQAFVKSEPPPSREVTTVAVTTYAKPAARTTGQVAEAVSPKPAAASKPTNTAADPEDTEDRQEQIWFSSWGKREERDRPCGWTPFHVHINNCSR